MNSGQIWWADLPDPIASESGYKRPVIVIQAEEFNKSLINTVVVVAITANVRLAGAPGNVKLPKSKSCLNKASVANVSQILTIDKQFLVEKIGQLDNHTMQELDEGITLVLGL